MSVDLEQARERAATAKEALGAYVQFENEVGGLMLRLVEQGDPAGLLLLELFRDLAARLGELYVEETK